MVATKDFKERSCFKDDTLLEAKRAVSIEITANRLDTLACAFALTGDFAAAVATETEATRRSPEKDFERRLERLKTHRDCTGFD